MKQIYDLQQNLHAEDVLLSELDILHKILMFFL